MPVKGREKGQSASGESQQRTVLMKAGVEQFQKENKFKDSKIRVKSELKHIHQVWQLRGH